MQLGNIINARRVINGFSSREDICARLAYWMTKFIVKTESDYIFYENEVRKLIDAYSIKDSTGNKFVPVDKMDDFNAAIDELNGVDVEDPGIRFKLSELSSELKLSMKQIYPLLCFIEEDM